MELNHGNYNYQWSVIYSLISRQAIYYIYVLVLYKPKYIPKIVLYPYPFIEITTM